ncbi:MAG: hypothetical protein Q7U57_18040 [Methylovulum sp.]|nr:hypothetical protein [Methylovulum sp.]
MQAKIFRSTIVLSFFICLLSSNPVCAKRLYRLVDQYGNTLFSDQVPAEQAKDRRELLSPSGRVLEVTEKAKSKEQQELEKHLEELRKEEEKLIARQKINDNALLLTFHSKEELYTALKLKMQVFDNQKKVLQGNLKNVNKQLQDQQKLAASFERDGEKVPKRLLDDINATQQQIQHINSALLANADRQILVKNEYNADIERYLFLTQAVKKPTSQTRIPSIKQANALGLFYCENDHQCNKAWEIAREFINIHSTTKPDVYNDKLIMNRPPATDYDISLSLSRIAITENDYQLFLDIHCQDSSIGEELCSSQKAKDLRFSFRSYVNEALSRTPQQ